MHSGPQAAVVAASLRVSIENELLSGATFLRMVLFSKMSMFSSVLTNFQLVG